VNDHVLPEEEAQPDLSTPELLAGNGEQAEGEVIEAEVIEDDGATAGEAATAALELPEDPAEAVSILISALTESRTETAVYLDTMQRVAAEFDNFRKRAARERNDIVDRATQRLIEKLLPTLDSFTAALAYEPQTDGERRLLAGMADTHRLLMDALATEGFEPIDANDVPFDPAVHEAVTGPRGEGDGELFVTEMRRGYTLRGRVVRAALVAVRHA
jgi:molecular chaperone GrpE